METVYERGRVAGLQEAENLIDDQEESDPDEEQ
jgi:hypothetical protein